MSYDKFTLEQARYRCVAVIDTRSISAIQRNMSVSDYKEPLRRFIRELGFDMGSDSLVDAIIENVWYLPQYGRCYADGEYKGNRAGMYITWAPQREELRFFIKERDAEITRKA